MTESKVHEGGCHCGRVRYEVKTDLTPVISCNCSICGKTGSILTFVPESAFSLLSGEAELTDYLFNNKVIHHLFCKVCGVHSFARGKGRDGAPMIAVNVRCLDGVDVGALTPTAVDGKSF